MRTARDATIAARIPLDLRDAIDWEVTKRRADGEVRANGEPVDISTVVREALRAHVNRRANEELNPRRRSLFDSTTPGAMRAKPTSTERAAALGVAARAGSQRRIALEHFEKATERGLTADDVVVLMAPRPHNGTARRVTDLLQGGLIEPKPASAAARIAEHPNAKVDEAGYWTRKTRAGAYAAVYRISAEGLLALSRKRKEEHRANR